MNLILIYGNMCSGKSTFANELHSLFPNETVILDHDDFRNKNLNNDKMINEFQAWISLYQMAIDALMKKQIILFPNTGWSVRVQPLLITPFVPVYVHMSESKEVLIKRYEERNIKINYPFNNDYKKFITDYEVKFNPMRCLPIYFDRSVPKSDICNLIKKGIDERKFL